MIELLCTDYNKKATFIHYNLISAVIVFPVLRQATDLDLFYTFLQAS